MPFCFHLLIAAPKNASGTLLPLGSGTGRRQIASVFLVLRDNTLLPLMSKKRIRLKEILHKENREYGLDSSPEMVKRAKENCCCAEVRLGSAEALPYQDESFDAVLMQRSFSLCEAKETVSGIKRVLKPGGKIIVTDLYSNIGEKTFSKSPQISNLPGACFF